MKKIIAQFLAVLVLASFAAFVAGCGKSDDAGAGDKPAAGAGAGADKGAGGTGDAGAGK